MSEKRNVLELTERERDVLEIMIKNQQDVLGGEKKRICISPAIVRDLLKEKYPNIQVYHVVASQDNLEKLKLISRIHDTNNTVPLGKGKRPVLAFEFNRELYEKTIIEIIQKRKAGYGPGSAHPKKTNAVVNRTKEILKGGRDLIEKKKNEHKKLLDDIARQKKKLAANEDRLVEINNEIKVVSDLLALRKKNLKELKLSAKEELP